MYDCYVSLGYYTIDKCPTLNLPKHARGNILDFFTYYLCYISLFGRFVHISLALQNVPATSANWKRNELSTNDFKRATRNAKNWKTFTNRYYSFYYYRNATKFTNTLRSLRTAFPIYTGCIIVSLNVKATIYAITMCYVLITSKY